MNSNPILFIVRSRTAICFLLLVWLSSCFSRKELIYLQDSSFSSEYPTQIKNRRPDYKIQVNDVLHVNIQNPDVETAQYFSYGGGNNNMQVFGNPSTLYVTGYPVTEEGVISIPLIGNVKVEGLSVNEARNLLQQEVSKFLKNSSVDLKLISFKISVMGEVNNPGYYYIYNGQATILEGLSLAGDITDYGNRNNIKLIRQNDDGVEVVLLDLAKSDVMKSKYYYLLPNDVIYVEPSERQIRRENLVQLATTIGAITALGVVARLLIDLL